MRSSGKINPRSTRTHRDLLDQVQFRLTALQNTLGQSSCVKVAPEKSASSTQNISMVRYFQFRYFWSNMNSSPRTEASVKFTPRNVDLLPASDVVATCK